MNARGQNARRADKRARGECVFCTSPAADGYSMCAPHLAYQAEHRERVRKMDRERVRKMDRARVRDDSESADDVGVDLHLCSTCQVPLLPVERVPGPRQHECERLRYEDYACARPGVGEARRPGGNPASGNSRSGAL